MKTKHIQKLPDHTWAVFFKRTISAQLHLFGCFLASIGVAFLLYLSLQMSLQTGNWKHFLSCLIFGITIITVFFASTVYHFLSDGYLISPQFENLLKNIDHFAIYFFIAGTYTPFLVNVIEPPWQEWLLIVIWTMAFLGTIYTQFKPIFPLWAKHRFFSTGIFLIMGWVLLVRINEAFEHMNSWRIFLMVAGGVSYTLGAGVYALERPVLYRDIFGFHELWHVMVMFGSAFHFFLILHFYL